MTIQILLIGAIVLGGLACLWFFVIHKHVAAIHAKVDTILGRTQPAPNVRSTATPTSKLP